MMTGRFLKKSKVIASHLIALKDESILKVLSFSPSMKWDTKNGLLLYSTIDEAYENMEIAFLLDINTSVIKMRVLYDSLMTKRVFSDCSLFEGYDTMSEVERQTFKTEIDEITFASLDGMPLILPPLVFPSKRILMWQAMSAYTNAIANQRSHSCAISSNPSPVEWENLKNHVAINSPECSIVNTILLEGISEGSDDDDDDDDDGEDDDGDDGEDDDDDDDEDKEIEN